MIGLKTPRQQLLAVSVLLIAMMFLLIPWVSRTLDPLRGYLAVFAIYWLCFCLPAGLWFVRRKNRLKIFSLAIGKQRWIPWIVGLQVGLVALSSWYMAPAQIPAFVVPAALAFAGTLVPVRPYLPAVFDGQET